ncbi:MAG: hypothetical protein ACHQZS_12450 [Candidatus Binatales bacterium]
MKYVAFEDGRNPGDWCVEAQDSQGRFLLAFFVGPDAKQRAEEYAAWKTGRAADHAASAVA